MAAAWDLTSPKSETRACEVTIFQMGGRLGGKAASSRNRARRSHRGARPSPLAGYYENAFRMVRTCFDELKRLESRDRELRKHLKGKPFDVGLAGRIRAREPGGPLRLVVRSTGSMDREVSGVRGGGQAENGGLASTSCPTARPPRRPHRQGGETGLPWRGIWRARIATTAKTGASRDRMSPSS